MKTKAIFSCSCDPITLGHVDIILRASNLFDLTIGICTNLSKTPLFTINERLYQVNEVMRSLNILNINVVEVNGLLAKYCLENNIKIIVRGLRNVADFEYESDMANINKDIGELETVFFNCDKNYSYVSSSAVKQLALLGMNHKLNYIPNFISNELDRKYHL